MQLVRPPSAFQVGGQVPQAIVIDGIEIDSIPEGWQASLPSTPPAHVVIRDPAMSPARGLGELLGQGAFTVGQVGRVEAPGEELAEAGMIEPVGPA